MIPIVLFGSFFALALVGVPIAVAMGMSSVIAFIVVFGVNGVPLSLVPAQFFASTNSFSLLAIPFFILAGNLMVSGGITERLVSFFDSFTHRITGGLAHVVTLTCMFFASLSGSSAATDAAVGKALIPRMEKYGYRPQFSAGVVASSGIIGMIIPPSIAMIVYGATAETSISQLFLGGVIPGVLFGVGIMAVSYFRLRRRPPAVDQRPFSIKEVGTSFRRAFWALTIPFIVLGGIYAGVFTATEAASVAIFYGLLVAGVFYRELGWMDIYQALKNSLVETSVIMFIIAAASLFGWTLTYLQIPQAFAALLTSLTTNATVFLLLMLALYLLAGLFANPSAAIVLLVPILLPTVSDFHIDPVYFGVFTVVSLSLGLITPPVGTDLFVTSSITGLAFEEVAQSSLPYLAVMVFVVVLVIIFPSLITWLPHLAHGG